LILSRELRERRPTLLLLTFVLLSLISLASGTEATVVDRFIRRIVDITTFPVLKARNAVVGSTDRALEYVFAAGRIRAENEALMREVLAMRQAVTERHELELANKRLQEALGFEKSATRIELVAASVIESYKGMLKIDKGTRAGLTTSLSVITKDGVVGVITEVTDFSASVATLHHADCRVGAMVQRNRLRAYDGVIHASGSDLSHICTMYYIDLKDDVRQGDLIVTAPESLFPSGYPIGRVTAVHESESLWKWAEVTPAVDPYSLDEVFVVMKSLPRPEDIEGPPPDPAAVLVAAEPILEDTPMPRASRKAATPPPAPDTRSLQERFAP